MPQLQAAMMEKLNEGQREMLFIRFCNKAGTFSMLAEESKEGASYVNQEREGRTWSACRWEVGLSGREGDCAVLTGVSRSADRQGSRRWRSSSGAVGRLDCSLEGRWCSSRLVYFVVNIVLHLWLWRYRFPGVKVGQWAVSYILKRTLQRKCFSSSLAVCCCV